LRSFNVFINFADSFFLKGTFAASDGQAQALCDASRAIGVSTTRDTAGYSSFPSIRTMGIQLTIPQPLVPRAARRTATIAFTTSQPISGTITISWPPGYFYGSPISATLTDVITGSVVSTVAETTPLTTGPSVPMVASRYFNGVRNEYMPFLATRSLIPRVFRFLLTLVSALPARTQSNCRTLSSVAPFQPGP
jgi:hypothetical protein